MNRSFHHNRVLNIAAGIVAYSTLTLIIFSAILIMNHVITNGPPTQFGIYG